MKAPQIIMIALWALSLGVTMSKNGEPRTDNHNVGWSLVTLAIYATLLWWGGFWS